jgi:hypothetical protein
MIDLTAHQIERVVETEKRCITPVGEETTVVKDQSFDTISLYQTILSVAEEVALGELHRHTTTEFHNTIGTIVNIRVHQGEIRSLYQIETIGTATIEVTVLH